jgi:hypothetical protein
MRQRACRTKFWLVSILLGVLLAGGALMGPQAASAVDSGPTAITGEGLCMQRIFIGNTTTAVTNSNKLNCTANDISIARALSATCIGPNCIDANTCEEGKTFTLNATFQVDVTANSRYDAGFFFRIDGGDSARGDGSTASGVCSINWLDAPGTPGQQLDGDSCGDLNANTYENVTFTIPGVSCTDSGDGNVKLPNCTSWHSNQGTACTAPTSASDPHRFDFHPDTKSKCVCDDTFTVPIGVRKPEGSVVKTATQAVVTYSVTVTNTSTVDTTVTSLLDSIYLELLDATNAAVQNNNCPGKNWNLPNQNDSQSCTFDAKLTTTTACFKNIVTATLHKTADGADTKNDVTVNGNTSISVGLNVGECPTTP